MVVQRQLVLVQVGGWVVGSRHTTECQSLLQQFEVKLPFEQSVLHHKD